MGNLNGPIAPYMEEWNDEGMYLVERVDGVALC